SDKCRQLELENVLLTNHSSFDLPYVSKYFDISLCKNTFHHFRKPREVSETILSLIRVTKSLVIISDFEKPERTGAIPELINSYYRVWRKDVGNNFLDERSFTKLFELAEIKRILVARGGSLEFDFRKSPFGKSMTAILRFAE